jgi:hypothetical protein
MPEKILRLGYSECTLLFIYWQNKYNNFDSTILINTKNLLINHLYTISGYYDNTINYTYMNAKHSDKDTIVYNKYMEILMEDIEFYNRDNIFNSDEIDFGGEDSKQFLCMIFYLNINGCLHYNNTFFLDKYKPGALLTLAIPVIES